MATVTVTVTVTMTVTVTVTMMRKEEVHKMRRVVGRKSLMAEQTLA